MGGLGRSLAALLIGGGQGLGGAIDDERERRRVAGQDADRAKELLFGRQLQSANATLAAREKGYVPQVSDTTKSLALLTGDTSGLPGGLAFLGNAARDTRDRMRARGTLQVPQPDGSAAELTYDPAADQGYQAEMRAATRRDTERETDRQAQLADEDRTRGEANRGAYQALRLLYPNDARLKTYDPTTNYGTTGTGLQKREADAADLERTRITAGAAATSRQETRDMMRDQQRFTRMSQLADDVRGDKVMQEANTIGGSLMAMRQHAKAGTPQSDISLIYAYMKLQDPGSTVREGEFATAQNAGGIGDSIRNQYNKLVRGEGFLTPDQRARMLHEGEARAQSHRVLVRAALTEHAGRAAAAGIPSEEIMRDPYTTVLGAYGQSAAAPARRGAAPSVPDGDRARTVPVGDPHSEAEDYAAAAGAYKADLARGTAPAQARATYDAMVRQIAAAHRGARDPPRVPQVDPYAALKAKYGGHATPPDDDPYAALRAKYEDQREPQPQVKGSVARGALALPLEAIPFHDEIAGGIGGTIDAVGNLLHGKPANWKASVDRQIEAQRGDLAAVQKAAPLTSDAVVAASSLAPAFLTGGASAAPAAEQLLLRAGERATPAGAGVARRAVDAVANLLAKPATARVAQNAARGAGTAMVYGAGAGEGGVQQRLDAGLTAAGMGALLGVAVPAAAGAATGVVRHLAQPAEDRAASRILASMGRGGASPASVRAQVVAGKVGDEEVLADVAGKSMKRRLDQTRNVASRGADEIDTFLEERGLNRPERLTKGLEEATGATRGNVVAQQRALEEARDAAAAHNYGVAKGTPPVDDMLLLEEIASDPVLSEAHSRAARVIARATKQVQPPLTRSKLIDGKPVVEYVPQPLATLDLMKRLVGDVIQSGQAGGSSVGRYEASISARRLHSILDQLDEIRPEYKTARGQFKHDIEMEQALEKGQQAFNPSVLHEEVADDLTHTIDDAKPYYRQGAARAAWGKTEGEDLLGTRSLNFFRKKSTAAKVDALAQSPEAAAKFRERVGRERNMQETEAITRGSQTARRLGDAADGKDLPIAELAALLTGNVAPLGRSVLKSGAARVMSGIGEQTANELASYLLAGRGGRQELLDALGRLESFSQRRTAGNLNRDRALSLLIGRAVGAGAP
jgi:hypothetical protein